jgi:hypothetical protein
MAAAEETKVKVRARDRFITETFIGKLHAGPAGDSSGFLP